MYALPWTNFYQKFPAAVASGLAPDLGLMHNFQVATNAVRGVITPVDSIMPTLGLTESDYSPTVWHSGVFDGRRYSVPLDVWPDSLFYNRRVLERRRARPGPARRRPATSTSPPWKPCAARTSRATGCRPSIRRVSVVASTRCSGSTAAPTTTRPGLGALVRLRRRPGGAGVATDLIESGFSPRNVSGSDANTAFKNDKNAFLWGGPGALINDLGKVDDLDWACCAVAQIGDRRRRSAARTSS